MSLIRQLWLAVIIAALVGFAGSMLASIWSAQAYLSQQLERKNSDVASSLALSLTHQEKDPALIELNVAALFDTGFYQRITLIDPNGKMIVQRSSEATQNEVPAWFVNRFPIEAKLGSAFINDGWKQYGTVEIVSHTHFAHQALWQQAENLLLWFMAGGGVLGALGMVWLGAISRSIKAVVTQAEQIGHRHFITIKEPRTPELRALACAMNSMVERVRQMFNEAANRLEELRRSANYDGLTNLPNRDYFLLHFREQLETEESVHCGALAVLRLTSLDKLNETLGRNETDDLLRELGRIFANLATQQEGSMAGRIKAGELAILLPGERDLPAAAARLQQLLSSLFVQGRSERSDIYHLGLVGFEQGAHYRNTMSRLDQALAQAETLGSNEVCVMDQPADVNAIPAEQWRSLLTEAVRQGKTSVQLYPVLRMDGSLLHQEAMVRLQAIAGQPAMVAGDFMPVAAHLNLTALIDFEVVRQIVTRLATQAGPVAINLSANTIANWTFRERLFELLTQHKSVCSSLWFEVAEYGAFKHFDEFRDVCLHLQKLGCHVGLEQFGQQLGESQRLTELGLDYVKIHATLVHDIEYDKDNQTFLHRFCEIAHAIGMQVIAVGVRRDTEWAMLKSLGVDAVTGPAIVLDAAG